MKRLGINAGVVMIFLAGVHGGVFAQSFASPATGTLAPSAWTRPEPIEEITPESLARVAAMRRQHQQAPNPALIAAAAPPNTAAPIRADIPKVSLGQASRDVAAENQLLAELSPTALEWQASSEIEAPAPQGLLVTASDGSQSYMIAGRRMPVRFPYSPADKFRLFIKDTYDPFALMGEGFTAFYNQAQGSPYAFGGGVRGYSRRFGAIVGTDFAGEFFGTFLFPSILHTDPRYFRKGEGNFGSRAVYALTRILITKKDSGGNTFNASNFLSSIATTAISNTYYPGRERGVWPTLERATINIGFDSLTALYREFWPEMAHTLHIPAFVIRRTADPMFPAQSQSDVTRVTPSQQN